MLYTFIGCAIIFLLFVFIYTRQPKGERVSLLTCAIAMLAGAIPCFYLAFFFQIFVSANITRFITDPTLKSAVDNFLVIALSEELCKFIAGVIVSKKTCKTRINYIAVFAAVGAGFDIMESSMQMNDAVSVAVRCLLAIHISLQIVMGSLYSKNKKVLALVIPILIHGVYDFCLSYGLFAIIGNANEESALLMIMVAIGAIAFLIWSLIYANRIGKEELKKKTLVEE